MSSPRGFGRISVDPRTPSQPRTTDGRSTGRHTSLSTPFGKREEQSILSNPTLQRHVSISVVPWPEHGERCPPSLFRASSLTVITAFADAAPPSHFASIHPGRGAPCVVGQSCRALADLHDIQCRVAKLPSRANEWPSVRLDRDFVRFGHPMLPTAKPHVHPLRTRAALVLERAVLPLSLGLIGIAPGRRGGRMTMTIRMELLPPWPCPDRTSIP